MPKLPPDLLPRTRQILLPLVRTEDEREALLTDSFYTIPDSRIYHQIKRDGTPVGFTTLCIKKLLDYGCLMEGQHALGRLLETTKYYCGVEKHATIDDIVTTINQLCLDIVPTDTSSESRELPSTPSLPTQTIDTPRDQRTPTVFISYSHADAEFAQRLIADLNAAGHACWLDTVKIKGGDEWIQSITEGINNSYAFISLVSPSANTSTWVRREFLWAEHKKKRIFPVMARPSELTIYLMERQVIMMQEDYSAGLAELLSVLPAPTLKARVASDEEPDTSVQEILLAKPVNRRRLELDYLEQLRAEVLFDLEKYTPLGGESQFIVQVQRGKPLQLANMKPEFEHLIERDEQKQETRRFENAVDEILNIKRAILLGEPGGGKTTTLLSLAGQLADTAEANPKAPIPIFVRLGRWIDPDQPLQAFIAEEMGALGEHLTALIEADRAVPLLDGMNEIPVSQRKPKYEQIRQFITGNPDWIAMTSCREQDYTVDLKLDRITVTPLDALRVREFVIRYLSAEDGEDLFWKIAGKAAKRFEARFQEKFANKLDDWRTTFWLAPNLPDNLEWGREFVDTFYYSWKEWREIRDAQGSLMQLAHNPYMLSMLTQVYVARGDLPPNRGELFRDFVETLLVREGIVTRDPSTKQVQMTDEAHELQQALSNLAYEMQVQRGQADDGNALTVLKIDAVRKFLDERQLYLAGSTSILDIGEDVRFTHQLLQEYFAARALQQRIFEGDAIHAGDIWTAPDWWQRTNWEEAVILLAGLYSDDCSRVVEWVNEANPEVAALCVTRSGAGLADATKEKLRAEWMRRLTDVNNEPNPHARAAIGRALGLTNWDNRKGVSVKRVEVPRLEGEGFRVRAIPDIDWVTIPAGKYSYQNGTKTLDYDFQISRYPVTYAQFQAFIDDPDGFHDPRWWQGFDMPDGHNDSAGDQAFKYWNHPRERVSWFDAMAFCRWLSHQYWQYGFVGTTPALSEMPAKANYDAMNPATWLVRLPTEFEWEKATRANTGWKYPWGDDYKEGYANVNETWGDAGQYYLQQTSAVGIYPQGDTSHWKKPISDLSGNVLEWCLTEYDNPAEHPQIQNISSKSSRVLRGGNWLRYILDVRVVRRRYGHPNYRSRNSGFRLVRAPSL